MIYEDEDVPPTGFWSVEAMEHSQIEDDKVSRTVLRAAAHDGSEVVFTVTDYGFAKDDEEHEPVSSQTWISVPKDVALRWARRLLGVLGDGKR